MKKINILYWISTGLVLFFFLPGSVMNIMQTPDWVEVFKQLGYPQYLLPFLGVAKLAGCAMLVIPGFPRLREWAYAGLFFDLVGATYSALMAAPFDPKLTIMFVAMAVLLASYFLGHKRQAAAQ